MFKMLRIGRTRPRGGIQADPQPQGCGYDAAHFFAAVIATLMLSFMSAAGALLPAELLNFLTRRLFSITISPGDALWVGGLIGGGWGLYNQFQRAWEDGYVRAHQQMYERQRHG